MLERLSQMHGPSQHPLIPLANTPMRYGIVAQTFHWVIAALVMLQFVLGIGLESLFFLARHKSIGFTIFGLVVLRLGWRLYLPPPPQPPVPHRVFRWAARLSHILLYALLLSMPV